MVRILLVYGTREGQAAKTARHVESTLSDMGTIVTVRTAHPQNRQHGLVDLRWRDRGRVSTYWQS